ncbi:hypothetical protein RN607_00775 [Demequina capsici]|uniref:DUF4429 domain-containing protein n=1 Tax=Demequina capsici TaxID=3075620 RepID=A0AA96J9R7_9MICO|nr:hypothetical protein [Demequina sp. PMTSA13]WNM27567.1 hypothetical protein RN607_00775 [Demequina sp. PMTSA13]
MGFKDAVRRSKENAAFQASFEGYRIMNGVLVPRLTSGNLTVPVGGCTADFDSGESNQRTTGTRVITGAILAGPVGAIVGGMFKKEKGKVYVTIITADGDAMIVAADRKDAPKARAFAAKVNKAGAWYAEHAFDDGSFSG